ncbi:MAG: RNA methyltransferase [Bacteroidota bacterium]
MSIHLATITRHQRNQVRALRKKKNRREQGLFIVEGFKSVQELLKSDYSIVEVIMTSSMAKKLKKTMRRVIPIAVTDKTTISSIGSLAQNEGVIAIAQCKKNVQPVITTTSRLLIADNIQNPSNLGALMRIADWYGIEAMIASSTSVDCYNSKVIQASMGSFTRVPIYYTSLGKFLKKLKMTIVGATLSGHKLHEQQLPRQGALVVGNESQGISSSIEPYLTQKVTIPRYGQAQSLNVAVAAGIICDYWLKKSAQ